MNRTITFEPLLSQEQQNTSMKNPVMYKPFSGLAVIQDSSSDEEFEQNHPLDTKVSKSCLKRKRRAEAPQRKIFENKKTMGLPVNRLTKKRILQILLKRATKNLETLQQSYSGENTRRKEKLENAEETGYRYPKRNIKRLSYSEDVPSDVDLEIYDEKIWAINDFSPGNDLSLSTSEKNALKSGRVREFPRYLTIRNSTISEINLGIWSEKVIPSGLVFGPFKGRNKNRNKVRRNKHSWMIKSSKGESHSEQAFYTKTSNWLRFLNFADDEKKHHLTIFQFNNKIYFKTRKQIMPFQELLVWYSEEYAKNNEIGAIQKELHFESTEEEVNEPRRNFGRSSYSSHPVHSALSKAQFHHEIRRRYKCGNCDYSTNYKLRLKNHIHIICNKVLNRRNSLGHQKRGQAIFKPYSCCICRRAFQLNQALRAHQKTHSWKKPFRCPNCHQSFIHLSDLTTHARTHEIQKPYKCPYCYHRTSKSQHLRQHISMKHSIQFPIRCAVCGKDFNRASRFKDHMKSKHLTLLRKRGLRLLKRRIGMVSKHRRASKRCLKPYKCNICSLNFARFDYLEKHKTLTHNREYPYKCSLCEDRFLTSNELREHKEKSHSSWENTYKVSEQSCDFNMNPKIVLRRLPTMTETRDQENIEQLNYSIDNLECTEISITANNSHIFVKRGRSKDFERKLYRCPDCEFMCDVYQSLSEHTRAKHTITLPLMCSECGESFLGLAQLKRHTEKFHLHKHFQKEEITSEEAKTNMSRDILKSENENTIDRKPFICAHCGFACLSHAQLSEHNMEKHVRHFYPFVCPQCGQGFVKPKPLREHFLRSHVNTVQKNKQIQQELKATKRGNIILIEREKAANTSSTKVSRFKCPHCDFICFIAQDLSQHVIAKHTKNRSYACCQCTKCFKSPSLLRAHFKKTHVSHLSFYNSNTKKLIQEGSEVKKPVLGFNPLKGKKIHKCPHCEYVCTQKQYLPQHIIVRHTKEYPMSCQYCGKGFTRKKRYTEHLKKCPLNKKIK